MEVLKGLVVVLFLGRIMIIKLLNVVLKMMKVLVKLSTGMTFIVITQNHIRVLVVKALLVMVLTVLTLGLKMMFG